MALGSLALCAVLATGALSADTCAGKPEGAACAAEEEEADAEGFAALQTQSKQQMESKRQTVSKSHDGSNASALGVSSGQTCYGYTGGSCSVQSCQSSRNSICQKGYCICDLGCAGPDGTCYSEKNKEIAKKFTLKNVKWPKESLYVQAMSTFGQMKVDNSWVMMGQDQFNLYQLPGKYEGKPMFLLGSHKWEETVAAMAMTTGTAIHPYAMYSKDLEKKKAPKDLAVYVCERKDGSIMIGSVAKKPVWAYVIHGSSLIYGYSLGDPKEGGYWMPEPKLPANAVPAC